jgi:putative peptidoglycan lipid II flippase
MAQQPDQPADEQQPGNQAADQEKNQAADQDSDRKVSRSAFKVTLGGIISMVVGLGTQVAIAALFGAGTEMDAYFTAMVIPTYLQVVLLGGLSFVFIPTFIREEEAGSTDNAWALAGTFFWLTSGILLVVAIIGALFARPIIDLSAPGMPPDKAELTANMLVVLIFTVPMIGLAGLTEGIQHTRNDFLRPAMAPALGSIANVVVLLALYPSLGAMALAWSYLAFFIVRASVTIVPVLRHGWGRLIPLNDARVIEMARLIAPFIFFGILTRSTPLLERYFASALPDGALSYIGYATKVPNLITGVIGSSITVAIFPVMARAYTQRGKEGLVDTTEHGVRLTLAVALPVLALVSGAAVPLIGVLFERGAFTYQDTLAVAQIVGIVVLGDVVFRMLGNVQTRTFYVEKDTITVPVISSITAVLYIFLARFLVEQGGYVGLAWAKPIHAGLAIVILAALMLRRLKSFRVGALSRDILIYGVTSALAFGATWGIVSVTAFLPALVQLVAAGFVGGSLYMLLLFMLDRPTAISILEMGGVRIISERLGLLRLTRRYAVHTPPR